jgi:hypothetical protein
MWSQAILSDVEFFLQAKDLFGIMLIGHAGIVPHSRRDVKG